MTCNYQPWRNYKRPFVRDLAFALACPDALTHWVNPEDLDHQNAEPSSKLALPTIFVHNSQFWRDQFDRYQPRLNQLDCTNQYQNLTKFLMNRPSPYRLGFHFEGLLQFWLEDGFRLDLHDFELLAHNIQLYKDKQTTGELDFILYNHNTNEVEHWEVAIKFYLGSPPYQFDNWVGLNNKDNLARKLRHMQRNQFNVSCITLDSDETVIIDKRYVSLKGRFFQSANYPLTTKSLTENTSVYQCSNNSELNIKPSCITKVIDARGYNTQNLAFTNQSTQQNKQVKPSWLNPNFPLHYWYNIQSSKQFEALNLNGIRQAHYIERFTQRPFYDKNFRLNIKSNDVINSINDDSGLSNVNPSVTANTFNYIAQLNHNYLNINNNSIQHIHSHNTLNYNELSTNVYICNSEPVILVV